MSNIIITETQLRTIQEKHFEGNHLLNEEWWNTLGDVVGIFDPTGIVDLVNGLDYIRQGEYFFGFLSMIAIVPYVGDVIAKPLMGVSKGSKAMKGVNQAMNIVKQGGDTSQASKILMNAGKTSSLISKLINSSISWGGKLKQILDKIPVGKLGSGLKKTITDWIDLFISAARQSKMTGKITTNFAKRVKAADTATATELMKELKKQLSKSSRTFRDFKITDPGFMSKYVWPGFSIRNRNLVTLMRRTKFYAGLLDYLGIGNFIGPEELSKKIGEENLRQKMGEYSKTSEGQKNWGEDMDSVSQESNETGSNTQPRQDKKNNSVEEDPFSKMLKSVLMGSLNPIPGM